MIPTFHEIKLNLKSQSTDLLSITELFKSIPIGTVPFFIDLSDITIDESILILKNIELAVKSLKINTTFPYPLYVISPLILNNSLNMVKRRVNLPTHFFSPSIKTNKGFHRLLHSIAFYRDKIINIEHNYQKETIDNLTKNQKQLNQITSTLNFYQQIIDSIEISNKI